MFFILGYPRSGSSFLVQTLKNDKSLSIQHESNLILLILDTIGKKDFNIDKLSNEICKRISKKSYRYTGVRDKNEITNIIVKYSKDELSTFQLIQNLIVDQSKKDTYVAFGDKYPNYTLHLEELYQIPNSKFIFLFRDPRDSFLSIKNTEFGPNTAIFMAFHWRKYVRSYLKHRESSSNFILMKYEDLINEPKKELENLYHYLEVEFDPSLYADIHIKKNNSLKWKNRFNFSKFENQLFELICKKEIKVLGYEYNSKKISIMDLFKIIIIGFTSILIEFAFKVQASIYRK